MSIACDCDSHAIHMRFTCNSHMAYTLHAMWIRQIFKYLLLNPASVVEGWRARLYFFSSGTLFKQLVPPLMEWLAADKVRRSVCLTKLVDDEEDSEMFQIIADVIFGFIKHKKHPFPGAMLSQKDFWRVPTWKRCIIYIFLFRLVLNKHATSKYYEWTSEEYHLTKKLFYRSVLLTPYLHSLTPITLTRTPGSKRRTER